MDATARRITAAASLGSPLAASAEVLVRGGGGASDAAAAWQGLGAAAPLALWGLPLAYVIFTAVRGLFRHPRARDRLAEPREATWVDQLALHADSHEGC